MNGPWMADIKYSNENPFDGYLSTSQEERDWHCAGCDDTHSQNVQEPTHFSRPKRAGFPSTVRVFDFPPSVSVNSMPSHTHWGSGNSLTYTDTVSYTGFFFPIVVPGNRCMARGLASKSRWRDLVSIHG